MRIKFNGLHERKSRRCGSCGKRVTGIGFVTSKMYILPSGRNKTFYVGRVEDVSDADGRFLLSYNTADAVIFEEVK